MKICKDTPNLSSKHSHEGEMEIKQTVEPLSWSYRDNLTTYITELMSVYNMHTW